MPRPSIDQVRSVADFTNIFRWNLAFAKFPSAVASPPNSEDLNLRCESAELPRLTGQTIVQNIRGHQVRQSGIYNYTDSLTLTFVETVDNAIHQFLKDWREATWETKTGIAQPKSDLEAIITLQRLNNQDEPIWEYKLVGAFLQDFDFGGTLDGITSESLKPQMILSYDFFEDQAL